jgi:hypothetical protein
VSQRKAAHASRWVALCQRGEIMKNMFPKEVSAQRAMEFSKSVVGTDVRFFPNARTMVGMWNIHAEAILKAMQYACIMLLVRDATQLRIEPTPPDPLPEQCEACSGIEYHHPSCPNRAGGSC